MIPIASILPGTAFLSAALGVALVLTMARPFPVDNVGAVAGLRSAFLLATAAQAVHFLEEYLTGFPDRFPRLLGLTPWGDPFFVVFNVAWLALWLLAAAGLEHRFRVALWPIWFLAIASIGNGVAHPLLALVSRGYFPGLVTSPIVGVLGVLLWRRLSSGTTPAPGTVA